MAITLNQFVKKHHPNIYDAWLNLKKTDTLNIPKVGDLLEFIDSRGYYGFSVGDIVEVFEVNTTDKNNTVDIGISIGRDKNELWGCDFESWQVHFKPIDNKEEK